VPNKYPIVLIVEDRPEVSLVWRRALEAYSEFGQIEIWAVDNLAHAKQRCLEIPPPDLILLDLRLTDSKDIETLAAIEDLKRGNPDVCVLIISGHLTEDLVKLAIESGAHGVQEKMGMTRSAELWSVINTAVQHAPPNAQKAIPYLANLIEKLSQTFII